MKKIFFGILLFAIVGCSFFESDFEKNIKIFTNLNNDYASKIESVNTSDEYIELFSEYLKQTIEIKKNIDVIIKDDPELKKAVEGDYPEELEELMKNFYKSRDKFTTVFTKKTQILMQDPESLKKLLENPKMLEVLKMLKDTK